MRIGKVRQCVLHFCKVLGNILYIYFMFWRLQTHEYVITRPNMMGLIIRILLLHAVLLSYNAGKFDNDRIFDRAMLFKTNDVVS